jgi:hypothetical protein
MEWNLSLVTLATGTNPGTVSQVINVSVDKQM